MEHLLKLLAHIDICNQTILNSEKKNKSQSRFVQNALYSLSKSERDKAYACDSRFIAEKNLIFDINIVMLRIPGSKYILT